MPASGEELPSWLLSAEEKESGAGREAVMEGSCPRASSSTVVHCSAATVLRKWYEKVLFSLLPFVSCLLFPPFQGCGDFLGAASGKIWERNMLFLKYRNITVV